MQVINYFFFRSELFIYSMITEYLIHARKASIAATTARSRQQTNIGSNFLSFLLANLCYSYTFLPYFQLSVCFCRPSLYNFVYFENPQRNVSADPSRRISRVFIGPNISTTHRYKIFWYYFY